MIFSIHFSANKIPTPPKPELSPDNKKLYLQCLPITIRVEQHLQHVSWTAQISILLLARISTTSLALLHMVPTFSLNLSCKISHDINLMEPTWTHRLLLTTSSHKVKAELNRSQICKKKKKYVGWAKIVLDESLIAIKHFIQHFASLPKHFSCWIGLTTLSSNISPNDVIRTLDRTFEFKNCIIKTKASIKKFQFQFQFLLKNN